MRLTGGALKVRGTLRYRDENGAGLTEKVSQIRIYSGMKYETAETVTAGQTCALLGLSGTYPGQGLGAEPDSASPVMEPAASSCPTARTRASCSRSSVSFRRRTLSSMFCGTSAAAR